VVGWAIGDIIEATIVLEALNRALGHRQIEPDQHLIHTYQGSQYRATAYLQLLEDHKISCSMSAKGCCWDNAVVARCQLCRQRAGPCHWHPSRHLLLGGSGTRPWQQMYRF
jgi:transposase InsO family protein